MITYKDTIPYIPKIKEGIVIKVYDGDTITIATQLPHDETLYRFSIRLFGIDTPEVRTSNEEEHIIGKKVGEILREKLMNKKVRLEDVKMEKYGRILATVFLEDLNICQWMIDNNHAIEYYGSGPKFMEKRKRV